MFGGKEEQNSVSNSTISFSSGYKGYNQHTELQVSFWGPKSTPLGLVCGHLNNGINCIDAQPTIHRVKNKNKQLCSPDSKQAMMELSQEKPF